jgi:hypothetical protein
LSASSLHPSQIFAAAFSLLFKVELKLRFLFTAHGRSQPSVDVAEYIEAQ